MGLLTPLHQNVISIPHAAGAIAAKNARKCCDTELCSLHSADPIWRNKEMKICWSLNKSREFHGELPAQSWRTKQIVAAEYKVLAERVRKNDKDFF